MQNIRPYLLDVLVGLIFILLPGIRGYTEWEIHEYAVLVLIYGYIIFLHHRRQRPAK